MGLHRQQPRCSCGIRHSATLTGQHLDSLTHRVAPRVKEMRQRGLSYQLIGDIIGMDRRLVYIIGRQLNLNRRKK